MPWSIEASTNKDWTVIKRWLKAEEDQHDRGIGPRGFWCNQKTIGQQHREGEMLVLRENGVPIAFLTGRPAHKDVMEVRPDKRSLGCGRALAEHWLALARSNDVALLKIECSPSTSVPFWKKMGFTLFPGHEDPWETPTAYQVLEKAFVLPTDGPKLAIGLALYPEQVKWTASTAPLKELTMDAAMMTDGAIQLAQRFVCFHPAPFEGDLVIEILKGNDQLYRDKVKYDEAARLGMMRDDGGTYYIDRLRPPAD